MTTEQVIKHFEDEIRFCERAPAGNPVHQTEDWVLVLEADKAALAALKEKQARENPKPLTEDELRGMIGKPVWVVVKSTGRGFWVIVDTTWIGLANGYTAYRYKPADHFPEVKKMEEVQGDD